MNLSIIDLKKVWFVLLCLIMISFICLCNSNNSEHFYLWNIPTRWNRPIYDIRGYPSYSWYFIHNGRIYDNKYIDMDKYRELYYYLPYYNNGMIYMANGKYTYNAFAKKYNLPILYYPTYDTIDWIGLINNGIINPSI